MASGQNEMLKEIFSRKPGNDLSSVERVFDAMGMGSGPYAPAMRMGFGAAVGYVLVEAVKPDFAYTPDGQARPWSLTQDGVDNPEVATPVPWWSVPAATGIICGMFV